MILRGHNLTSLINCLRPHSYRMLLVLVCLALHPPRAVAADEYRGTFFEGKGDVEYLELLDIARRMFSPDPEYQSLPMLYTPAWNGLVEGPTWDAWWIQNSYGTTYAALPFLEEPWITFLQNSQDLWFDQMGDGKRAGNGGYVAPDGSLCDAARPGEIYYRQGDGRVDIHDWGMEFTAAGLLLEAELLLISREPAAIARYLPRLERCANFIETRRDPRNNLFLAGPAGNLLAPSYAGWRKPDGTYGMAYLAGLSITYIAALDRLIELERLMAADEKVKVYSERRDLARKGLALLLTEEGYFVKSVDPDGTRHGVYGAEKHGYLETSPNHDAIAFRVVDDGQAEKIYAKIASIPGLRPHAFVIPNYPSLDDMYEQPQGLWAFGTWVNGGHWSTCEARMVLAYYRLGKSEDARRSMKQLLTFARAWRMDNPLVKFGSDVYQPGELVNLCYDTFGPAAALVRGLFELRYTADGLTLVPHIPPGVTELKQKFPIRFGGKRLTLASRGNGKVTAVAMDGKPWTRFDANSVFLPHGGETPEDARILVALGGASTEWPGFGGPDEASAADTKSAPETTSAPKTTSGLEAASAPEAEQGTGGDRASGEAGPSPVAELLPGALGARVDRVRGFLSRLAEAGLRETYEAAHAKAILDCTLAIEKRQKMMKAGVLKPLAEAARAGAAERAYADTVAKLLDGLEKVLGSYDKAQEPAKRRIREIWIEAAATPSDGQTIDRPTLDRWSAPYRGWHYWPDFVLPPSPDDGLQFQSVDCPLVWELDGEWQMWYTGFDGRGYQTALATSDDLVHFKPKGVVMSFGKPGAYDHGGVTFGGLLLESYDIKAPRKPKKWPPGPDGKYWVLYGCYPKQGGYEIRPGAEGAAWSLDGRIWRRASEDRPILSIDGAAAWEKDCIYQPWLVEHDGKFWDFYNAANGGVEQTGFATSTDMLSWKRHPGNPVIRNGGPGSYDEQFCSDGKVFRDGDHWVMFYFGVGRGGAHIMAAFSRDLVHWASHPEPLYVAGGHPGGLDKTYAHKISLVYRKETDTFYMFYCAVGPKGRGIGLLTSRPLK